MRTSTTETRRASHAGSWYSGNRDQLTQQMDKFLSKVPDVPELTSSNAQIKALIGPHAGYAYSAKTAAYAYKYINVNRIKRIVVMGPSHRKYIRGVALCASHAIETPLGNLRVDVKEVQRLRNGRVSFEAVDISEEEQEHSLEMHFPWIAKLFADRLDDITVLPFIVGDLTPESADEYASKVFAKYLEDPETLFCVSSDFCHWGNRFSYTYYSKSQGAIYKSIEHLDRMGMEKISTLDPKEFRTYLKEYRNTICGRNPILLLMHTVQQLKGDDKYKMEWLDYSQSNQVIDPSDSSVSYASGVLVSEG